MIPRVGMVRTISVPRPRVVLEWVAVVLISLLGMCVLAVALAVVVAAWSATL